MVLTWTILMSIVKLVIPYVKLVHSVQLTVPLAQLDSYSIKLVQVNALKISMDRIISVFLVHPPSKHVLLLLHSMLAQRHRITKQWYT